MHYPVRMQTRVAQRRRGPLPFPTATASAAVLLALVSGAAAGQADIPWPDYRGPAADGRIEGAAVPTTWSESENLHWRTPIHGRGWSTPVASSERIWLTTATEDGRSLSILAVDVETGEVEVDRVLFEVDEPQERHDLNSFASPSCVLDERRVYVHFGDAGTACLDQESGETVWLRRDIRCDHMVGPGSSPILFEDLLVFHVDGIDVQFVIALDKATGETRWETVRNVDLTDREPDLRKAYSTPIVVASEGREVLISTGAEATFGYDPRTGEELWMLRHGGFSMSSRPVAGDGLVFLNTGFNKPRLIAKRIGGSGDVSQSHVAWSTLKSTPTMPSPILHDGLLYMVSDNGMASCLDARTGEERWRERLDGAFSASLLLVDDRLYAFDRDGVCTVLRAGGTFEVLARNELSDGCMASPIVVGDRLIVRTQNALYALGGG